MGSELNVDLPPRFEYDEGKSPEENLRSMDEYILQLHAALEETFRRSFYRSSETADSPTADNIATLDEDGNVTDSGVAIGLVGTHASRHENAGADEISVTGLSGLLADTQHSFVDRGDPTDWDYEETGDKSVIDTDGTWHDLDLSAIVPARAVAVLLHIRVNDDATASMIRFRENGNSNTYNRSSLNTVVANISHFADLVVACDSNRVIEYLGDDLAFANIDIVVKGWWL